MSETTIHPMDVNCADCGHARGHHANGLRECGCIDCTCVAYVAPAAAPAPRHDLQDALDNLPPAPTSRLSTARVEELKRALFDVSPDMGVDEFQWGMLPLTVGEVRELLSLRDELVTLKREQNKTHDTLWKLRTNSGVRDWPEDAEHENGCYRNTCITCNEGFNGHKRRVLCRVCDDPVVSALRAAREEAERLLQDALCGEGPNCCQSCDDIRAFLTKERT